MLISRRKRIIAIYKSESCFVFKTAVDFQLDKKNIDDCDVFISKFTVKKK